MPFELGLTVAWQRLGDRSHAFHDPVQDSEQPDWYLRAFACSPNALAVAGRSGRGVTDFGK
jgi:hypothetical protein